MTNKFLTRWLTSLGVFLLSFVALTASASAACTLADVGPASGAYVSGGAYNYTVNVTPGDTCGDDGVIITGYYLYDSDGDADFTDEGPYQQFAQVSPAANDVSYNLTWNTLARTDGLNTRYKSRVILTGGGAGSMTPATFFGIDNTAPILNTATTKDTDQDGLIDRIDVTFTEAVGMYNINPVGNVLGWTVTADGAEVMVVASAFWNGQTLELTLTEQATVTTEDTPSVAYSSVTGDSYTDLAGNEVVTGTIANAVDGAAPAITLVEMKDDDFNGKIEKLSLTFSENIALNAGNTNHGFTFAGHGVVSTAVNNFTIPGGSNTLDLTLTEGAQTYETSIADLALDLAGSDITDGTNTMVDVTLDVDSTPYAITDKAAPYAWILEYQDNGNDGSVDRLVMTMSENIITGTAEASDFTWTANDLTGTALAGAGTPTFLNNIVTYTLSTPTSNLTGVSGLVEPTVAYADDAGRDIADTAGNQMATFGARTVIDKANPVIIDTASLDDVGGIHDGNTETIEFRFSESVQDADFGAALAGFIVSDDDFATSDAMVAFNTNTDVVNGDIDVANDAYVTLTFTPTNVSGTGIVKFKYTNNGSYISDAGNNSLLDITNAVSADDFAAPQVISQVYQSNGNNGSVDRLVLTLSEIVSFTEAQLFNDFAVVNQSLTSLDDDGTPTSVTGTGTNTLTFVVSGTTDLTGVSGGTEPTIAFTDDTANHIADVTGNSNLLNTFVARSLVDDANPYLLASHANTKSVSADEDGTTDYLALQYSEKINSVPTADQFTVKNIANADVPVSGVTLMNGALAANDIIKVSLDESDTDNNTAAMTVSYDAAGAQKIVDAQSNEATTLINQAITDDVNPVIMLSQYFDINGDAQVDQFTFTFSEDISTSTYDVADWSIDYGSLNGGGTGAVGVVSFATNVMTVPLTGLDADETSSSGTPGMSYTNNAGNIIDSVNNEVVTGGLWQVIDKAAPVLIDSLSTGNGLGQTDEIDLVYSEDISANSSLLEANYIVEKSGTTDIITVSLTSVLFDTITLNLDTTDTDQTTGPMQVTYTGTVVYDEAGATDNAAIAKTDTAITDGAEPVIMTRKYQDNGSDGSVDRLVLTFSENVEWQTMIDSDTYSQLSITANDLTGFVGNPTAVSGESDTITYTIPATTNLTGVDAGTEPDLTYLQDVNPVNRLRDASSNYLVSNGPTAIDDNAAPIVTSVLTSDAGENGGTALDGIVDAIIVTYSESIVANSTFTAGNWSFANAGANIAYANAGAIAGSTVKLYVTQSANYNGGEVADVVNASQATDIEDVANNFIAGALNQTADDAVAPQFVTAYLIDSDKVEVQFTEDMHINSLNTSKFTVTGRTTDAIAFGATNDIISLDLDGDVNTYVDRLTVTGDGTVEDVNGVDFVTVTNKSIIGGPTIVGLTLNTTPVYTDTSAIVLAGRAVSPSSNLEAVKYCIGTKNLGTACVINDATVNIVTPSSAPITDTKYENFTITLNADDAWQTGVGTYSVYVASKANGVWGDSSVITLNVETAPVTDTTAPTISSTVFNPNQTAFTVTDIATGTFTVIATDAFDDDDTLIVTVNGTVVADDGDDNVGTYVYTLGAGDKTTGIHTFNVQVTDTAGNLATKAVAYSVVADDADATAPVIANTVFNPNQTAFTVSEIGAGTFTVTATDAFDDSDTLTVTVNGSVVADNGNDNVGTYVYTLGAGDKTTGIHTFNVQVTDAVGNLATEAVAYSVVADGSDTTVPTISSTVFNPNQTAFTVSEIAAGTFTVTATDTFDDDDTLTVTVNGTVVADADGDNNTGTYTYTLVAGDKTTGIHTFNVQVTDTAGNLATKSVAYSVVADDSDTTSPTLTFTPANGTSGVAVASTITITFDEAVRKLDDSAVVDGDLASMIMLKEENASGTNVAFTAVINGGKTEITITPTSSLDYNQDYYVAIDAQLEDSSDNTISASVATFSTQDISAPNVTTLTLSNITNNGLSLAYATDVTPTVKRYKVNTNTTVGTWVTLGASPVAIPGLNADTTYFIQVQFTRNGHETNEYRTFKTSTATSGLVVNNVERILNNNDVTVGGNYSNGYHFRFQVTANNYTEENLKFKLADWSNGVTTMPVANNTKVVVTENGTDDYAHANIKTLILSDTYTELSADISAIDGDDTLGGRQFVIDVFYQIPTGSEGVHSSKYGIKTESGEL